MVEGEEGCNQVILRGPLQPKPFCGVCLLLRHFKRLCLHCFLKIKQQFYSDSEYVLMTSVSQISTEITCCSLDSTCCFNSDLVLWAPFCSVNSFAQLRIKSSTRLRNPGPVDCFVALVASSLVHRVCGDFIQMKSTPSFAWTSYAAL